MRSRNTFTSLCFLTAFSICGQHPVNHVSKSRRLILPTRKCTTRGGGDARIIRCEKSASFVTIARSCRLACFHSSESDSLGPRLMTCRTGNFVLSPETAGRFSSNRKPVMKPVQVNIGCASVERHALGRPGPGIASTSDKPATPHQCCHQRRACRALIRPLFVCRGRQDVHCKHQDRSRSRLISQGYITTHPVS